MNIHQLEYLVAVDEHRHFARAAEFCHVTQPTLSAMIHKLEEELNCIVFDRSKQPVRLTPEGEKLIIQAKKVLHEVHRFKEIACEETSELSGNLRLGIIPTLAPYLLPFFLKTFTDAYPKLKLQVQEMNTDALLKALEHDHMDAAILASPLKKDGFREDVLFYEKFHVYSGEGSSLPSKRFLLAEDIDLDRLWLLEEGHCLRNQVVRLCELKKKAPESGLSYASGSIESLLRMVDSYQGITVIPELAFHHWEKAKKDRLRAFADPVPQREISLVTYRHDSKRRSMEALKACILDKLPGEISRQPGGDVLGIA